LAKKSSVTFAINMNKDRFGIICLSTGFGGLEINTLRLITWMSKEGWQIPLLVREGTALAKKAVEDQFSVAIVPENNSAGDDLRFIDNWVKEQELDLLFLPFNNDLKIISKYKRNKNRGIKLIYQQHMQVGVKKRDFFHTRRYKMLDAWISPLQYLKEETLEKTRVPESKIHVIPFGIDLDPYKNSAWNIASARSSLLLPVDPLIIGVLGRIDPKKGQDLVVRATHKLFSEYGIDCHLLMVGDATINEGDTYSREIAALIENLGIKDRIHLRGYMTDVMQFFRAIDIFAMPSHGETFGMVTIEAMAAGVPVVGTDTDGTKEILCDGKLGALFPLNDVEVFCRQVLATIKNQQLPQLMQAGINEVTQEYDYKDMIRRIGELISELTAKSRTNQ